MQSQGQEDPRSFYNPVTQSWPFALHFAGYWGKPEQEARHPLGTAYHCAHEASLAGVPAFEPVERLTVLTCSTFAEQSLVEKSARSWGLPLRVVGKGVRYFDWYKKWDILRKALPRIETEYLLYVDSKDVMFSRNLRELIPMFEKAYPKAQMIFNAECHAWPPKAGAEVFEFERNCYQSSPWCYLNAGLCLVRTAFLRAMIPTILAVPCARAMGYTWRQRLRYRLFKGRHVDYDDQEALHHFHRAHYPEVVLDYQCKLFQVTGGIGLDWSLAKR
jgi:hypothetical protein